MTNVFRFAIARCVNCLLLTALVVTVPRASDGEEFRQTSSLKFVSADVEFYTSSLRLREQYDVLVKSKAFAAVLDMPVVKMGLGMLQLQWNNAQIPQVTALKAALEDAQNKQLLNLLADAVSHEVFLYGADGYASVLQLANDVNRAQRMAQIEAVRLGSNPQELLAQKMLEAVTQRLDGAKIPDTVMGFKLSDPKPALEQLARLEAILPALASLLPQGGERVSRQKIAGGDFLTVRLDGSLIPWARVFDAVGQQREALEKLAEKVKPLTLVVNLGVWNDYLILSTGDTDEHLQALGKGELLADRKELAPLGRLADRRLASISYVSEAFVQQANNAERQIDDMLAMGQQLLPLAKLGDSLEREIVDDMQTVGKSLKQHVPKPHAASSFAYLTGRGLEGFQYSWGENVLWDASGRLTILQHVGGNPLFVVAGRSRMSPECYQGLKAILVRGFYYAEKIGMREIGEREREVYEKAKQDIQPLFARLEQVTREMLLPATQDGQGALVLDAKSVSTQWHQQLPPSQQPLPMFELAVVHGVNDASLLKKAGAEYFATLQAILDKLHAAQPDEVPEIKLPPPQSKELPEGTVYFYPLPPALGVDQQVSPSVAVGANVLAIGLLPGQVTRLLVKTPLQAEGPLAVDRPLGSAVYLNWSGLMDAIAPWADFGISLAMSANANDPSVAAIKDQVRTGLRVLRCFRGVAAVTYPQDGIWVTHFESRFEDLP